MQKKIAAVQDISGFGRCSLSTAIPVLSAFGFQCCPVPTAVLSAHTEYPDPYIVDMSGHLGRFVDHFVRLGLSFDAVYSGYLGSHRQVGQVMRLIDGCAAPSCLVLVDPVMGDNGVSYVERSEAFDREMRLLVSRAHVITPNLTEAAILLGVPFAELGDRGAIRDAMRRLAELGPGHVVVTGVRDGDRLGCLSYSARDGEFDFYAKEEVPGHYPGTGDLFASVLLGELLSQGDGFSLRQGVRRAVDFVVASAELTYGAGSPPLDGVQFERLLGRLCPGREG